MGNFLLWQSAYSGFLYADSLADFWLEDLFEAVTGHSASVDSAGAVTIKPSPL